MEKTSCKGCTNINSFPKGYPCTECERNPPILKDHYHMSQEYMETLKRIAGYLDGMEYGYEQEDIWKIAKKNGCVIVFGYSDDCIEFRGAYDDECGCYDGKTLYFSKTLGVSCVKECTNGNYPNAITAVWCGKVDGREACPKEQYTDDKGRVIPWTYLLDMPHADFMVYEDKEPYCRGVVFFAGSAR